MHTLVSRYFCKKGKGKLLQFSHCVYLVRRFKVSIVTSLRHFQGVDLGFRGHVKCAEKKFTLFYLSCYVRNRNMETASIEHFPYLNDIYRPGQADVQFL